MNTGIVGAGNIGGTLAEEIGFAPFDTGSLREGGRKQQPGSPIYNKPVTLERAKEIFNRVSR